MSRRTIRNRRRMTPEDIEFRRRMGDVRAFVTKIGPRACESLVASQKAIGAGPDENGETEVVVLSDLSAFREKLRPRPPTNVLVIAVALVASRRVRFGFVRPPFEVS